MGWTPDKALLNTRALPRRIRHGWSAPLYNLYFDSFLLICTSFVVRTRGIVCVVYLLSRLTNYKDPCKRCVLAPQYGPGSMDHPMAGLVHGSSHGPGPWTEPNFQKGIAPVNMTIYQRSGYEKTQTRIYCLRP